MISMIVPLVMLDIMGELYHQICFRLYRIPRVRRRNYIRIARQKLAYLNWMDKINCMYCGYANGLLHYALVIAGKTEEHFCGIAHKKYKGFVPTPQQKRFVEYGDEKAFKKRYKN